MKDVFKDPQNNPSTLSKNNISAESENFFSNSVTISKEKARKLRMEARQLGEKYFH